MPDGDTDWRPRPDPTILTTEALHREIGALERLITERMNGTNAVINERFTAQNERLIRIEGLAQGAAGVTERLDEKVAAGERRLDTLESASRYRTAARTERRLDLGQVIAVVAVIVAIVSVMAFILKK